MMINSCYYFYFKCSLLHLVLTSKQLAQFSDCSFKWLSVTGYSTFNYVALLLFTQRLKLRSRFHIHSTIKCELLCFKLKLTLLRLLSNLQFFQYFALFRTCKTGVQLELINLNPKINFDYLLNYRKKYFASVFPIVTAIYL